MGGVSIYGMGRGLAGAHGEGVYSASLRESEGGALSGVQGQSPWAGGLGDRS